MGTAGLKRGLGEAQGPQLLGETESGVCAGPGGLSSLGYYCQPKLLQTEQKHRAGAEDKKFYVGTLPVSLNLCTVHSPQMMEEGIIFPSQFTVPSCLRRSLNSAHYQSTGKLAFKAHC